MKIRTMTPEDCSKYCDLAPQYIREMLKAGEGDFGTAFNPTGKRWRYVVIPSKFFAWLGVNVPKEWSDDNEELN